MTLTPRSPKGQFLLGNLRQFTRDTLAFLLDLRQHENGRYAAACRTGVGIKRKEFNHREHGEHREKKKKDAKRERK